MSFKIAKHNLFLFPTNFQLISKTIIPIHHTKSHKHHYSLYESNIEGIMTTIQKRTNKHKLFSSLTCCSSCDLDQVCPLGFIMFMLRECLSKNDLNNYMAKNDNTNTLMANCLSMQRCSGPTWCDTRFTLRVQHCRAYVQPHKDKVE